MTSDKEELIIHHLEHSEYLNGSNLTSWSNYGNLIELHSRCENCEYYDGWYSHDFMDCIDRRCFREWVQMHYSHK